MKKGDLIELLVDVDTDTRNVGRTTIKKGSWAIINRIHRDGTFDANSNGIRLILNENDKDKLWTLLQGVDIAIDYAQKKPIYSTWEKAAKPVPSEFKGSHNLPIDLDFDDYQEY